MDMKVSLTLETMKDIPVSSLAFNPSGSYLAAASQDGELTVWHTRKWEPELNFRSQRHDFNSIQFTKDWKLFASGLFSFIEVDLLKTRIENIVGGHINRISPDGKIFAASQDLDAPLPLYKDEIFLIIGSYPESETISEYQVGDTNNELYWLHTLDLLFSPDSKIIAVVLELDGNGLDLEYRLYLLPTGEHGDLQSIFEFSELIQPICFSPDNNYLAFGNWEDCSIDVFRIRQNIKFHRGYYGFDDGVSSLSFSPDGRLLASGSADMNLRIMDIEEDRLLTTFQHSSGVTSLAFHPTNATLALGDESGKVHIVELIT